MMDKADLNWIPTRTSWQIENQEGLQIDDEDDAVLIKRLQDQMRKTNDKTDSLVEMVEGLRVLFKEHLGKS